MAVTPMSLTNGIYLQSTEYQHESHLDQAHVIALGQGKAGVTDLGVVETFVQSGYLIKPYLYSFSKFGANRIYVDGHIYKWSQPQTEEPFYIVEDISETDKPGLGGEKFKIKVNKRKYDHGFVIAADQHDSNHLLITPDEIIEDGEHVILTVKLKSYNQQERWFPKDFLRPGTRFFAITTYDTEYNQTYPSIPTMSGGVREFFNTVGETSATMHYSITRDAAFSMVHNQCIAGLTKYKEIIEMYQFKPGSLGYDMSLQNAAPSMLGAGYAKKYGADKGMAQMKSDIALRSWVPKIEALGMAYLEMMVQNEAMWGSGGLVDFDGATKAANSALGLYHQLNMGNQHHYNLYDWNIEKFEYVLASRLKNRIEPFKGNTIKIKTGQGGLAWVKNQLRSRPSQAGMILQASDFIQGLGKNNNQSLRMTNLDISSWVMSNGYGTIEFELAPGLDPIDANEIINPMVQMSQTIGGHRLSSYMFIIEDIVDLEANNIVELVYGPDWDMRKSVIQGKLPYMGNTFAGNTWQRSNHHPGFEVFLEKRHSAYWVKDVTRSLIIKPLNPLTGKPIFNGFFQ